MDVPQKDLSYFRLRLQELLNSSFPEKAHDQTDNGPEFTSHYFKGWCREKQTIR